MAATLTSVNCVSLSKAAPQCSVPRERFSSASGACPIVCKSQRNSRYEKSKKHARGGHATIPQQTAVVPSNSLPHHGAVQAKKHSGMEARKERGSSTPQHAETPDEPSFESPISAAAAATVDIAQPASGGGSTAGVEPAEQEKAKSHWDDFWAPRLFWVFRALGTVVD